MSFASRQRKVFRFLPPRSIDAKGGLSIVGAEETSKTSSTRQEKKSGISISYSSGKDLTILATDGSITSQGAQISVEGNALIVAKDNIKFDVAHNTESGSQDTKKSGFNIDTRSTQVVGMLHNNGTGNGDTVTGTKLSIYAARDLMITSAQDTLHNANQSNNKAIGKVVISDTERFSGYHDERHKDNSAT